MKRTVCCIILLITLSSCQKTIKTNITGDSPMYTINIEDYEKAEKSLGDFVTNFKYVQLKNIPMEDFISEVKKVEYHDNKYFILDEQKSNLLVFNNEGEFLYKIGNRGNGPGEFKNVNDFAIDKGGNKIILLGAFNIAIFIYDLDGEFVKKIQYEDFFPKQLTTLNDNYILYTSFSSSSLNDVVYSDNEGKILGGGFAFPENVDQISFAFTGGIFKGNSNHVLYASSGSPLIYQIDQDLSSFIKYKIDLGRNAWQESSKFDLYRFDQELRKMRVSFLQNEIVEAGDFLYFSYMDKNKEKRGYFDTATNVLFSSDSFLKDGVDRLFYNICGVKEDKLVAVFNPQYYEGLSNRYKSFKEGLQKIDVNLYNEMEKIVGDTDPYLLTYNYSFNE